jgi:hypothetical protein
MAYPAIAELEAQIKAGSHEDAVDDMWLNIGPLYFPLAEGFTTVQSRPRASSGQNIDFRVRKFVNGNVRVLIVEVASYEHQDQASVWAGKKDLLKDYLTQTLAAENQFEGTLFGVITIRKASQFFSSSLNSELRCLHDESEAYTFKDHRADVDHWMVYMREQILAGN